MKVCVAPSCIVAPGGSISTRAMGAVVSHGEPPTFVPRERLVRREVAEDVGRARERLVAITFERSRAAVGYLFDRRAVGSEQGYGIAAVQEREAARRSVEDERAREGRIARVE